MNSIVIVDISRMEGTDEDFAALLPRVTSEYHTTAADVIVVASEEQESLRGVFAECGWRPVRTWRTAAGHVTNILRELTRRGPGTEVTILSYNGFVIALKDKPWGQLVVNGDSLKTVRGYSTSSSYHHPPEPRPAEFVRSESVSDAAPRRTTVEPESEPASDTTISPKDRKRNRQRQLQEPLEDANRGPLSHGRLAAEDAVDRLMKDSAKDGTAYSALELVQRAVEMVPEILAGYPKHRRPREDKPIPQRELVPVLLGLMLDAQVAIGEDERPLSSEPMSRFAVITQLADNWRDEILMLMIRTIVQKGPISDDDLSPLTGVLFYYDDAECQGKVIDLLRTMVTRGQLRMYQDGEKVYFALAEPPDDAIPLKVH